MFCAKQRWGFQGIDLRLMIISTGVYLSAVPSRSAERSQGSQGWHHGTMATSQMGKMVLEYSPTHLTHDWGQWNRGVKIIDTWSIWVAFQTYVTTKVGGKRHSCASFFKDDADCPAFGARLRKVGNVSYYLLKWPTFGIWPMFRHT